MGGKEKEVLTLERKGIPWKPKEFYEEHSMKKQSISRMLTELSGRGLVTKYHPSRTSHVQITEFGIKVIATLYLLGDSDRGYRDAIRKAKKAGKSNPQQSALEGRGILGPEMSVSASSGLTEFLCNYDHFIPDRRRYICNFVNGAYDYLIRNM